MRVLPVGMTGSVSQKPADGDLLTYVILLSGEAGHVRTVAKDVEHAVTNLSSYLQGAAMMVALALAAPALGSVAAQASERKLEEVRRAVERGEIPALAEVLAKVRPKLPGEVVRVEIERKSGRWLYEFRVIDANGRLYEVYVEPKSGTIEKIKEK